MTVLAAPTVPSLSPGVTDSGILAIGCVIYYVRNLGIVQAHFSNSLVNVGKRMKQYDLPTFPWNSAH